MGQALSHRLFMIAAVLLGFTAVNAHADSLEILGISPPSSGQAPSLTLTEATSPSLLKAGKIDFSLAIELDQGLDIRQAALEDALTPTHDAPNHILVFQVAMANASRRVVSLKPMPSTVFLGYSGQTHAIAPDDPIAAQAFSRTLSGPHNKAQAIIGAPQPLGKPLVFDYTFNKAVVQARRNMTVMAYLIDRRKQTYIATTIDASEKQTFEVAYRVSRYDPKYERHIQSFDTEDEVVAFEQQDFPIKLSALLNAFAANQTDAKPFTNISELRHTFLLDRNKVLRAARDNTFDARPLNDPRFDSVVAIYTGSGTIGSGFFVTPNVVMTNWHVVQDHRLVELKMYDGQETFGTVLGKDARLDIALIQVQNRGRPVAFYTGRVLDLGQDVEAIGHPRRLEFALTRGVISAVRKAYSINMPSGAGDKVLYIQTDTPINPGNSGGPLFLGNQVIGMNTWGLKPGYADGLNFSIHYAELMNFLNEHLPGYSTSPAGEG